MKLKKKKLGNEKKSLSTFPFRPSLMPSCSSCQCIEDEPLTRLIEACGHRLCNSCWADECPACLSCSICTEKIQNKTAVDPCGHFFCFECIRRWSETACSCPGCNLSFKKLIPARGNPVFVDPRHDDRVYAFNEEEEEGGEEDVDSDGAPMDEYQRDGWLVDDDEDVGHYPDDDDDEDSEDYEDDDEDDEPPPPPPPPKRTSARKRTVINVHRAPQRKSKRRQRR